MNNLESLLTDPFQQEMARVTELLRKQSPELFEATTEKQDELRKDIEQRENRLRDTEIITALAEYGIDGSKIEQLDNNLFSLPVSKHFANERLPGGYGYKGGAARALLLRALGIDSSYMPRDLDIIRLMDEESYVGADKEIAQRLMPVDNQNGAGVETILSDEQYLNTRDLTLNELLATDERIIATRACILDTVRHIIRPTQYERERSEGALRSGTLAKMLRFYAESILRYDEGAIADVEDWEYERYFLSPFWLSLNLDKAFERGQEVAQKYIDELKQRHQIPENIKTPEDAATYLSGLLRGEAFYYRHAPVGQFMSEHEHLGESYEHLPSYSSHSKDTA